MGHWEIFHHEADVGVRGTGGSIEEAFEQAALALTGVITDPALVACRERLTLRCAAPDLEILFFDFINALVYEMATRRLLFGSHQVHIEEGRLRAEVCGEPVDPARHDPAVEVKGATFTELKVTRDAEGGWLAQCVVDV